VIIKQNTNRNNRTGASAVRDIDIYYNSTVTTNQTRPGELHHPDGYAIFITPINKKKERK